MRGGRRIVIACAIAVSSAAPARRALAQHAGCDDPHAACTANDLDGNLCCKPVVKPPPVTKVEVSITTMPAGATVSIDGADAGTSPFRTKLKPGDHAVVAVLAGYQTGTTSVHVKAGKPAQVSIALVIVKGHGTCADAAACVRACDGGNPAACTDAGDMYQRGKRVAKDPVKAIEYFDRGCTSGDADGCEPLAALYAAAGDPGKAAAYDEKGCTAGAPSACAALGEMTEHGDGVRADVVHAEALYQKACDANSATGCFDLGVLYVGRAREREGLDLIRRACEAGSTRACDWQNQRKAATDDDHDGIANGSDRCPSEPEDKDGFQDTDGCPDADNDGDGVADAADRCPNQVETRNGFQDADGCPDVASVRVTIEVTCGDARLAADELWLVVDDQRVELDSDASFTTRPGHHWLRVSAAGCSAAGLSIDAGEGSIARAQLARTSSEAEASTPERRPGPASATAFRLGVDAVIALMPEDPTIEHVNSFDSSIYERTRIAGRYSLTGAGVSYRGGFGNLEIGTTLSYASMEGMRVATYEDTNVGGTTASNTTVDLGALDVHILLGVRIPIVYVSLHAGVGLGMEFWFLKGPTIDPSNPTVGTAPVYVGVEAHPSCHWSLSGTASHVFDVGLGSTVPDFTRFTFGAAYAFAAGC